MYRLTAKIEITGAKSWRLEKVTEVEITRDTEKLTDECRLTLPKKNQVGRRGRDTRPARRRGESVAGLRR